MNGFLNDDEIISLFFSRDESAISRTEEKYGKLFKHIAFNILESAEDTEECVNDVYMKLWNAIPPEKPLNLKAYGAKTARNTALNRAEYNQAGKRILNELCTELNDSLPDTAAAAESDDLKELINAFLRSLKKETRVIFVLRYFYGEQTDEIASMTNSSETKVRSQLFRTRKKLKEYLEKEDISI